MAVPVQHLDYIAPEGGAVASAVVTPEAANTLSLDTAFGDVDDGPPAQPVTPEWDDDRSNGVSIVLIADLSEAVCKSLSWKTNKKKTEHPLASHLQSAYDDKSLKATICDAYPNLEELLCIETIEEYPLSLRLFLYGLCAMLSGLPPRYGLDPWELVAKTWCSNCSGQEMKDGCVGAIEDFLDLHQETMDDERKARMHDFVQKSTCSLNWQREKKGDPLPTYLKETYSKKDPFSKYIFGYELKPAKWDYVSHEIPSDSSLRVWPMFLFATEALIARSTTRPFTPEVVAGCSKLYLDRLKPQLLLQNVPLLKPRSSHPETQLIVDTPEPTGQDPPATKPRVDSAFELDFESEDTTEPTERPPRSKEELAWAMKILTEGMEVPMKDRPPELNRFSHRLASQIMDESKTSEYISTVSYKAITGQKIEKSYMCLPRPTKDYNELGQHSKKKKANMLQAALAFLVGPDVSQQEALLMLLLKPFEENLVLMRTKDFKWTDGQLMLMLSIVGSANKLDRLDRLERMLKGCTRFPPQLKKKLRKLGSLASLKIDMEMIPLKMNAKNEVKPQLSWRISEPLKVVERLVEATYLAGKFEQSESFSRLRDKIILAFGADKDTYATSELIRLVNRSEGNCSDHVSTLALFENAAECYENMAKTILKKGSSTHQLLQLLLDNKLFALTVNSEDDGKILESTCVAFNLFADHRETDNEDRMLPQFEVKFEHCSGAFCARKDFKVTAPQDFRKKANDENLSLSDHDDDDGTASETASERSGEELLSDDESTEDERPELNVGDEDEASESSDDCEEEEVTPMYDDDEDPLNTTHDEDDEPDDETKQPPSLGMQCIGLKLDEEWKNGSKRIWIQLVFEDTDMYYAYRIYLSNPDEDAAKLLVAGFFEKPIQRGSESATIDCDFRQVVGFISCDKKNSWAIMGMMESASARLNCISCLQPQSEYKKNGPDWMVEYGEENKFDMSHLETKISEGLKDHELRCGKNSCTASYHALQKAINHGNHQYGDEQQRNIREEKGGVVNDPLLEVPPEKQTNGPLHNGAGLENHFKDNTESKVASIDAQTEDGKTTDLQKMHNAKERCKLIVKEGKAKLRRLKTQGKRVQAAIDSHEINLANAMDPDKRRASVTDAAIERMRKTLEQKLAKKKEIDIEHGRIARLSDGTAHLLKSIESYLASKKPKGPAQWALRKAIELADCRFNPQHGGMDLSHADGLSMLENWDDIVRWVCGTYKEVDATKHAMVVKVMKESQEIAKPLFAMNTQLKSQKKFSDADVEQLKYNSFHVFKKWLEFFPEQGVFPKLHDMAWHIPAFIMSNRMYGRLSEEAFESRHQVHNKLYSVLRSMPNAKERTECFNYRIQFYQLPEYAAVMAELEAKSTKKKRGPYKTTPKNNSLSIVRSERAMDGDNVRVDKGMSIESDMIEVYNLCVCGIVPPSWSEVFNLDELTDAQKLRAQFSSQTKKFD